MFEHNYFRSDARQTFNHSTDRRLSNGQSLQRLIFDHAAWAESRGRTGQRLVISNEDLRGLQVDRTSLAGAVFDGCAFDGAVFSACALAHAQFIACAMPGAIFAHCNLASVSFKGCELYEVDFRDCRLPDYQICPEVGAFTCFKKLRDSVIAVLEVPAEARRTSTLVGRKCRAEFAKVLEFRNTAGKQPVSTTAHFHNVDFNPDAATLDDGGMVIYHGYPSLREGAGVVYVQGQIVRPDHYNHDFREECTHGIHFFMTEKEAREY